MRNLQSANPILPGQLPNKPLVVRAVNRASVVLLCSYLESYLRGINEEASNVINSSQVYGVDLPVLMRLRHSQTPVDEISGMQWNKRDSKLQDFLIADGWLWRQGEHRELDHARLLRWMKSPFPNRIKQLFLLWGVSDIFSAVTRRPHTKTRMWLRLTELVEKRNAIAHGDLGTQATGNDIASYMSVVNGFCQRADGILSRRLARLCKQARPW